MLKPKETPEIKEVTPQRVQEEIERLTHDLDLARRQVETEYSVAMSVHNSVMIENSRFQIRGLIIALNAVDHYKKLILANPQMSGDIYEIIKGLREKYLL